MLDLWLAVLAATFFSSGLALEKPEFTWVSCSCKEPAVMGLSEQHFIAHQMYMEGLEHELRQCQNGGGE